MGPAGIPQPAADAGVPDAQAHDSRMDWTFGLRTEWTGWDLNPEHQPSIARFPRYRGLSERRCSGGRLPTSTICTTSSMNAATFFGPGLYFPGWPLLFRSSS